MLRSVMKLSTFLLALTFIANAVLCQGAPSPDGKIKNILYIISDDLKTSSLGCYGSAFCKTPNIDRLADESMRFTRAYCQATYCGPSRASFMSGYYPSATGVLGYVSGRSAIGDRATNSTDGWTFKVDQEFANQGIGSTSLNPPTTVTWSFGDFDGAE